MKECTTFPLAECGITVREQTGILSKNMEGGIEMGKEAGIEQNQTQLAVFMKEVRENFLSAGKSKSGWLRNLLEKLFK
jgi:hypothetical protein